MGGWRLPTAGCRTIRPPRAAANWKFRRIATAPQGRKLRIFAAVLPANTLTPKDDPLVIIAGGPGQAASTLAPFAARLSELRRTRDVVLIDQRGTGRSSPLDCAAFRPREDEAFDIDPLPRARACADELKAKGVDAAQYTTTAWVADLEAMREALGYERWNLWGGSYGTRVAQEYLRRHPQRVRTMILDSVAPPGMIISLDVWRTREAALAAVYAHCAASERCRTAHPDLAATFERSACVPRARRPRRRAAGSEHRRDPARTRVVRPRAERPAAADLRAGNGKSAAANARAGRTRRVRSRCSPRHPAASGNLAERINAALHFSVTCAEDVPRITTANEARALDGVADRRAGAANDRRMRGVAEGPYARRLRAAGDGQTFPYCCCRAEWIR